MELKPELLQDIAYQLVESRGGGEQARKEAREGGEEQLITWAFLNLDRTTKSTAILHLLASRDTDMSLGRLADSIDSFNKASGKLYWIYLGLTFVIAIATIANVLATWFHK